VRKNPPLQAMEGGKVQYRNMKIWQIREWEWEWFVWEKFVFNS
jgi:hypothetical protein